MCNLMEVMFTAQGNYQAGCFLLIGWLVIKFIAWVINSLSDCSFNSCMTC